MSNEVSRGEALANRRSRAAREILQILDDNARNLPILTGLNQKCQFSDQLENVLLRGALLWQGSGRIFKYGDSTVQENGEGDRRQLFTLVSRSKCQPGASAQLANIFICAENAGRGQNIKQFPPPPQLIELLAAHAPIDSILPRIETYSNRPLFDDDFQYCGVGYHANNGYLIHGPQVEPILFEPTGDSVHEKVPPTLMRALSRFPFRTVTDLVHAIAMLLTGLLVGRFIEKGKPLALVDGNQPSLGKSYLVSLFGLILDGVAPDVIKFTADDAELGKRVGAELRTLERSVLLIDNAKLPGNGAINSSYLEAMSVAPMISDRTLQTSTVFRRPNDVIWTITMNNTSASPDLIARSLPIRLYYEGNVVQDLDRRGVTPWDFVKQNRIQILGELAGLVIRWLQAGRPMAQQRHRLQEWASIIGGILEANGLLGFMENVAEAQNEFDTELSDLAQLAETCIRSYPATIRYVATDTEVGAGTGLRPKDWVPIIASANILANELSGRPDKGKSTRIGTYFSANVGKTVCISNDNWEGTATLRMQAVRSNQKKYYFDVRYQFLDGGSPQDVQATSEVIPESREVVQSTPMPIPPLISPQDRGEGTAPTGNYRTSGEAGNLLDWGQEIS